MSVLFKNSNIDLNIEPDDWNELKNRILYKFGYPSVNVEITDPALKYIVKDGLQMLSTYNPKVVDTLVDIKAYKTDYVICDMDGNEYDKVNSIIDCGVSSTYLIGMGLPVQAFLGMPLALAASNDITVVNDFMSLISAHNTSKNIFQVMPLPELIFPNIVRFNPAPYMNDRWLLRITIDHLNNLGSIDNWELDWLIKYCTCETAKYIGTIRSKYDGIQLPVGTLSGSGSSLRTEAIEQEKELIQELKDYPVKSCADLIYLYRID